MPGAAVLTRDRDGAAPYAAALAPLGLTAVAMPVTRAAPPADPDALARALGRGGHAAIACASARGAAALAAAAAAAGAEVGALPPVWAVGPATARALAAAGLRAIAPPGARDAATLAAALIAALGAAGALPGARVLAPRAEDGRDEAIAALRAAGAEVEDVIAYRTVAADARDPAIAEGRALIAAGAAALCAVFAPSQVAALAGLVGAPALRAQRFAAIGETTAAALRGAGVPAASIGVAPTPTPAGIASAAAAVYPPRS